MCRVTAYRNCFRLCVLFRCNLLSRSDAALFWLPGRQSAGLHLAGSFVTEELAAAYDTALSSKRPGEPSLLPRSEQWGLVIWEPQREGQPWWRLRTNRWWVRRAREVEA